MQDDPADRPHDLHPDRDQRLPQPRDLRPAERGPVRMELQFLEEDERGRRQGDAQLIGPEARTAGAPEGEGVFQFLEAILTVAAGAIHVGVDPLRRLAQIRDDETRVIARHSSVVPHHFGFDNGAPGHRPGRSKAAGLIWPSVEWRRRWL